ncbi:hypothetical protein ABT284_28855, partial [Nocardioides sp. NPDC000441]
GRVADVICLSCRTESPRRDLQERMEALNAGWGTALEEVARRRLGNGPFTVTATAWAARGTVA